MPMRIGEEMPGFEGASGWENGNQEDAANIVEGSPLLVHFWAVSCGICKEKMPQLIELKKQYGEKGLKAIAIHMPRYEADSDMEAVLEAISKNGITELCAIDNQHKLRDSFKNEQGWVPVYYLFDREGKLKTRAAGEFGLGILATALEKMFAEDSNQAAA